MRLAFFTPLTPQKSGISDYSEELLPFLAPLAEVDLVIGDGYAASKPEITTNFRIVNHADAVQNSKRYDLFIYQIANSYNEHAYMVDAMRRVPGMLVLHDYCLQYLMLGVTLRQGDARSIARALQPAFGPRAAVMTRRLLLHAEDPNTMAFSLPLIEMSKGVVVHSDLARRCVEKDSVKLTRVIAMGVPLDDPVPTPEEQAALKVAHGFSAADFILTSCSTLSYTKRLDLTVSAIAALRDRFPRLRLLIIGGGSPGEALLKRLERDGLSSVVRRTGWVSNAQYRELIRLSDAVIDLRYPSGAETSASLSRALAAGKPAIVSAQGTFIELPDDCAVKVPVRSGELESVQTALAKLIEDRELHAAMSKAARVYAEQTMSLASAARAYVDFARELAGAPAPESGWFADVPSAPERLAVSTTYKIARLAYLYRNYGMRHTIKRLREETRGRR